MITRTEPITFEVDALKYLMANLPTDSGELTDVWYMLQPQSKNITLDQVKSMIYTAQHMDEAEEMMFASFKAKAIEGL